MKSWHFQPHRRHAHLFSLFPSTVNFYYHTAYVRMPAFALKNNRSPWTAVLPPPFLRQSWWLTVGLTIPFSHHLLAVNQACHPGAIDRAVSLCETCLSKPLYTVVNWVLFFSVLPVSWFLSPYSWLNYEVITLLFSFFQVAWWHAWWQTC